MTHYVMVLTRLIENKNRFQSKDFFPLFFPLCCKLRVINDATHFLSLYGGFIQATSNRIALINILPPIKYLVKALSKRSKQKLPASYRNRCGKKQTINSKMYLSLDNVKISHVSSSFLLWLFMCMFAFWHVAKIYC